MYCVQCSQLCTIIDWPFRDKAYFGLTLLSRDDLWLFYRAQWERNDEGDDKQEKIEQVLAQSNFTSQVEHTFQPVRQKQCADHMLSLIALSTCFQNVFTFTCILSLRI